MESLRQTLLALLLVVPSVVLADWTGKVVGIADGDTLTVLRSGKGIKVRLVEIDAPESRQDFGAASKKSLSDLCFGKPANVQERGTDKYGRTLGRVVCDGVDANLEQVRRGMAWFYVQYGTDQAIRTAEVSARTAGTGLWAEADPTPPWDYRHGDRPNANTYSHPPDRTSKRQPAAGQPGDKSEAPSGAQCGAKSTCGQMTSCAEARHYLDDCGLSKLDRDHDGIPCESLCR